jgi:Rieske Fe-S protein
MGRVARRIWAVAMKEKYGANERSQKLKYHIRQPTDGDAAKTACWVRCVEAGKFQVFAINCAHLGCPVRWFEQSKLFMCPCHGGVYYQDGTRAAGPPPRGLFEYKWKVEGGKLLIDAGRLPGLEESV